MKGADTIVPWNNYGYISALIQFDEFIQFH